MSKPVAKVQSKPKKVAAKKSPAETEAAQQVAIETPHSKSRERDPRLPAVGTVLTKERGRQTHEVTVLVDGFEYKGDKYRSLSKIARVITGVSWNGYAFFGLIKCGGSGSNRRLKSSGELGFGPPRLSPELVSILPGIISGRAPPQFET